ncbi:MAG: 23S rRNA (pseudouridine(1915)-N(3))-methyltransferase RlmH [Gammaproteobacteria bacterium]
MKVRLLACGTRMPRWVTEGYKDYANRLNAEIRLELQEIPLGRRYKKSGSEKARAEEGKKMLQAIGKHEQVIALDVSGYSWSTEQLAEILQRWLSDGRDVALLVGGPDGLADDCLARAETKWSLSPLTLPHTLVRILAAEQVYRAWTLLHNHPYHRA